MTKTKLLALLLAAALCLPFAGCAEITDKEGAAWAQAHGYVKADTLTSATQPAAETVDAVASATEKKQGGVNYGAIEWDAELQAAAVREFLKGGKYLGDVAWAQDETGYNYREMYQMATIHGDAPANTNLELVLDASNLHLLGTSEAGTGKTLDFAKNANVSISWCRQLREEEETAYNYYCSYGVQYNGKVRVYTLDDLNTTESQDALINLCDKYYPTLASTWAAYGKGLKTQTTYIPE